MKDERRRYDHEYEEMNAYEKIIKYYDSLNFLQKINAQLNFLQKINAILCNSFYQFIQTTKKNKINLNNYHKKGL